MTRVQCAALALYILGLGFLGGMLAERLRFDARRTAILQQYEESVRQWQTYRITIEKDHVDRAVIESRAKTAD